MPDPEPQNRPPTCASCGADVSGLSREEHCPTCGVKIAPMDGVGAQGVPDRLPASTPPEAPTRIDHSIGCTSCGYNLRGLMSDGKCPECGSAIEPSLRPAYLRFSPPEALARLNLAAGLLVWLVPGAWGVMSMGGTLGRLVLSDRGRADVFEQVLTLTLTIGVSWAWSLLAAPDNLGIAARATRKGSLAASQNLRRRLVHAAAIAACASVLAWMVFFHATPFSPLVDVLRSAFWTSMAALTAAGLSMAHLLAYRSDDSRLANAARNAEAVAVVMLVVELFGLLSGIALAYFLGRPPMGCFVPARLLSVVILIQAVLVLSRLRRCVRRYLSAGELPPPMSAPPVH